MTNNTPDFDKMSPEELMAWMESLAKRQGATEGLTTAADMDVPEVDPSQVQIDEPGYIPYGMDTEKWEAKKAEEERQKAERRAQMQQSAPPPAPKPVQPAPQPVTQAAPPPPPAPAPTPAPAASSGALDVENMSPEQLIKWMESLAARSGATEGLTTSADMEVPEIDASQAKIDEPGYIPYGMDPEKWRIKQEEEAARKAARAAASITPPPAPVKPAAPPAPPQPEPVAQIEESFELDLDLDLDLEETAQSEPAGNSLAWLESLAADTGSDLPGLDLSGLDQFNVPVVTSEPQADPLAWLESLSQSQESIPGLDALAGIDLGTPAPAAPPARPAAQPSIDDPLRWLESLAKRNDADVEELITSADLDIPVPTGVPSDAPGYTAFTVESADADQLDLFSDSEEIDLNVDDMDENMNDWLTALAAGKVESAAASASSPAFMGSLEEDEEVPPSTEAIMSALEQGKNVSPDEISSWMSNLLEEGARRTDVPDYIEDEEEAAGIAEAELPDWLLQQVGAPPVQETVAVPESAPLTDDIVPPTVDMPDWLRQDMPEDESLDFNQIFVEETSETSQQVVVASPGADLVVDTSDPWVEAFEEERRQGDAVPKWYLEKIGAVDDEEAGISFEIGEAAAATANIVAAATAAFTAAGAAASIALQKAVLPAESELSEGEPMEVPDWMDVAVTMPPAVTAASPAFASDGETQPLSFLTETPVAAAVSDMPDWLREQVEEEAVAPAELPEWLRGVDVPEEAVSAVPDWLRDSIDEEEATPVVKIVEPAPAPQPVPAAPAAKASPAPIVAAAVDVVAALSEARAHAKAGNVEVSLQSYEAVVRANQQLDVVVNDLAGMLNEEKHKKNPAVYRVLGDSLMRQGNLQQALDTYRKALNLL